MFQENTKSASRCERPYKHLIYCFSTQVYVSVHVDNLQVSFLGSWRHWTCFLRATLKKWERYCNVWSDAALRGEFSPFVK